MIRRRLLVVPLIALVAVLIVAASSAIADQPTDAKQDAHAQMQLPPGWTQEDMQACMASATLGEMHEFLAKSVGVWQGKNTCWMYPGAEPMKSESTAKITPMMDGRFIQCEMSGDMPGMGPYKGLALYGFDNVSQKFVSTWIDNCGTGMAQGTGELSSDRKTLTWTYTYPCPIRKGPATLREVQKITGEHTKKLEIFATDPKGGKEFKMMEIELTRKPGSERTATAAPAAAPR